MIENNVHCVVDLHTTSRALSAFDVIADYQAPYWREPVGHDRDGVFWHDVALLLCNVSHSVIVTRISIWFWIFDFTSMSNNKSLWVLLEKRSWPSACFFFHSFLLLTEKDTTWELKATIPYFYSGQSKSGNKIWVHCLFNYDSPFHASVSRCLLLTISTHHSTARDGIMVEIWKIWRGRLNPWSINSRRYYSHNFAPFLSSLLLL